MTSLVYVITNNSVLYSTDMTTTLTVGYYTCLIYMNVVPWNIKMNLSRDFLKRLYSQYIVMN